MLESDTLLYILQAFHFIYLFRSNLSEIKIKEACSLVGTGKVMVE